MESCVIHHQMGFFAIVDALSFADHVNRYTSFDQHFEIDPVELNYDQHPMDNIDAVNNECDA
ncbi:hypothetical protein OUZ56_008013 [Daphnia magna]|uniref:Uncharacterized protein n=1 Tax=Daphnia magna TaxID=35525 RepID=A0ABR0ABQ7_9CRUS|nr:hypothetical protein OUZ56_008013 [Daphnia magna]